VFHFIAFQHDSLQIVELAQNKDVSATAPPILIHVQTEPDSSMQTCFQPITVNQFKLFKNNFAALKSRDPPKKYMIPFFLSNTA
jgi:spermidine/putrescine-binding protein